LEPVIVDFGLAVYIDDEDYVYNHCGTPGYIPPESFQFKDGDVLSSVGDIFSLGVIFHVLLTGKYLFEGNDIQTVFQNNREGNFDLYKEEYEAFDSEGIYLLRKML
jgi:serine/threonine protein kinase